MIEQPLHLFLQQIVIDVGLILALDCFGQPRLGTSKIGTVVRADQLGFFMVGNKVLKSIQKGILVQGVCYFEVYDPFYGSCKQVSIAFQLSATSDHNDRTKVVHTGISKWWVSRGNSVWR